MNNNFFPEIMIIVSLLTKFIWGRLRFVRVRLAFCRITFPQTGKNLYLLNENRID